MLIKIIFLLVAIVNYAICMRGLVKISFMGLTPKESYRKMVTYAIISILVDVILFWGVVLAIPQGEYGTGIEILMVIILLLVYLPYTLIMCIRICRQMREYENIDDIKDFMWRYIPVATLIKILFVLVETIWFIEVK